MRDHCCWGIHSLKVTASIFTSIVTVIVATTIMRLLLRDCLNSILSALQYCSSSSSSSRHALLFLHLCPSLFMISSHLLSLLTSFPSPSLSLLFLLSISHKPISNCISPSSPPYFSFQSCVWPAFFPYTKSGWKQNFPQRPAGNRNAANRCRQNTSRSEDLPYLLSLYDTTPYLALFYFDREADTQSFLHPESWNFLDLKYLHTHPAVFSVLLSCIALLAWHSRLFPPTIISGKLEARILRVKLHCIPSSCAIFVHILI